MSTDDQGGKDKAGGQEARQISCLKPLNISFKDRNSVYHEGITTKNKEMKGESIN